MSDHPGDKADALIKPRCPDLECGSTLIEERNMCVSVWPVRWIKVPSNPNHPVIIDSYGDGEAFLDSSETIENKPYTCLMCSADYDLEELAGPRTRPEIIPDTEGTHEQARIDEG